MEISGIGFDITENKINEEKITQSLREKNVLLKEVHHRVKNNMQVISSILNLQSSYVRDTYALNLLKECQNRIKSMAFIHESLYQTKNFESVNFSEYVTTLSKNLVHTYSINTKKVKLILTLDELMLNLDASIPCGLIINEIISNSLKYAFPDNRDGIIFVTLRVDKNKVKIEVGDNGIGIPENVDIKNTQTLGLQLVDTLVEQLSGTVKLKRSKGTIFSIEFNKYKMENNNINVYIVEDENIVAKDIQNSLKKLGYNVLGISNNGADAIKNIVDLEPNIVLMDIMIKGPMTGIDVAETIKKDYNIPAIFLTAYADESTLAKAKVTEPYGYILKPFKEIDLHSTIEMALYKHKKDTEVQKERDFLYSLVENKDEAAKDILFVKSNSRLVKVNLKDIFYVEALKDYVVLNTQFTRYTIHSTMKDIEKKLNNGDFIRVHRSFIARIDKIQTIENQTVVLEENKKVIPIGGSYRDELLAKLNMI